ncbi:hypothetical protein V496_07197 [Pseudogymnoascus sp. VKM F-4515 (FW-2607)]|nr:hypothetical protein V496_07197 [Pseudogymnoascus sp. VKM F-4515 (FW-2607)]
MLVNGDGAMAADSGGGAARKGAQDVVQSSNMRHLGSGEVGKQYKRFRRSQLGLRHRTGHFETPHKFNSY